MCNLLLLVTESGKLWNVWRIVNVNYNLTEFSSKFPSLASFQMAFLGGVQLEINPANQGIQEDSLVVVP